MERYVQSGNRREIKVKCADLVTEKREFVEKFTSNSTKKKIVTARRSCT